jgi:2-deoxy-D-gluconate 3-dehydrogenase
MTNPAVGQQFYLGGKVALVTGGGMGIGKGIAQTLVGAGASVMIADINMEVANKTVEEIRATDGRAAAIYADVSVVADASKAIEATVEEFGRLDILVNNAGYFSAMPFLDVSEDLYNKMLDINLKGTFFFAQAAARQMMKEGHGGRIINIASVDAFQPTSTLTPYGASKSGVVSLTKGMAKELARHGILVNAVAPGGVATPGAGAIFEAAVKAYGHPPEEIIAALKSTWDKALLNRTAEPEEIGNAVLFLASPASDYIVGTVIVADGGIMIG